jgi:hypothetical protein
VTTSFLSAGVVTGSSGLTSRGLTCAGRSDVRENEPAEGSLGRAKGFRAGEGPVGGRADGTSVIILSTLDPESRRAGIVSLFCVTFVWPEIAERVV